MPPVIVVVGSLALSGCMSGGGGGGSGRATTQARPPAAALAPPQAPASFLTTEFNTNWGLGQINAEEAYADGAYGGGVTVAVVDSGIDTNHPDLANNISPDSIDIVSPGTPLDDISGHGTKVAGIVAAEKNGVGSHGVAFDATILAVRADEHCGLLNCSFFDSDIARAVDYSVVKLAHVINMSLGGPAPNTAQLDAALASAAQNGVIMVASTGNAGASEPEFPAAGAGDPMFDGLMIAVGSVDQTDTISSFSNACGSHRDFCLMAPGEAVETTRAGESDADNTATVSGTSFSAPHVSGAAALLIQRFPNLTAQEVVQILLTSATDLGDPGTDEVYGRGLLDLEAAVNPIGSLSVPLSNTAGDGSSALADTSLELGSAFGNALGNIGVLGRVIALDDFDRPYPVDLNGAVSGAERGFGLESLLAPATSREIELSGPAGFGLSMTLSEAEATGPVSAPETGYSFESLNFSTAVSESATLRLGYRVSAGANLGTSRLASGADGLFWSAGETLSPHYQLLGSGSGANLDMMLGEATMLSLGWFQAHRADSIDFTGSADEGTLGQANLAHRFGSGANLRLGLATLDESEAFLGSESEGAFGAGGDSRSFFVTLAGGLPLGETFELLGSYTMGTTSLNFDSGGILSDWSTVRSNAFGVGAVAKNVLRPGDRFGLLAGQPLRVYDADATLTVPVALDADENVIQESERVAVTPTGREIDLQFAYDTPLIPGASLSTWLLMQLQPGHDADAEPGYGAGLKFRFVF